MKSLREMTREELIRELEDARERERAQTFDRRFQMAVEATNDGIWEWDVLTGDVYFSPRYFTMLGYEPDVLEHCFETWESLLHPDDAEHVKKQIFSSMDKGEPFSITFRLKNSQGEWQWILARGRIVEQDARGRPTRLMGTHVDIHEQTMLGETIRKQNEELTLLNRLGRSVSRRLSLKETVDAALNLLRGAVECDLLLLFLLDGERIVSKGICSELEGTSFFYEKRNRVGECLCGRAVETRKPVFSREMAQDPVCCRDDCRTIGITSFAAIPLVSGETVLGVIGIGSLRKVEYERREPFLVSAASVVASGVANALMDEKIQKYSENLEDVVRRRTEALAKMNNAIERVSISVIITDATGTIEYANPFFTELTGYSIGEVLGKNPRILKSGVHDGAFYKDMWHTLRNGLTWRGEICNCKKDGSTYWERASISPLKDDSGTITHFIAVKEDITDRREREQRLLILSKAIRNAASSVVVTDANGGIVYVNPSFSELTGYASNEVMGKNPRILKSGLHQKEFYDELWATISSGKAWKGEFLNRRKDGTQFWLSARIAPVFDQYGIITHYVGVQHDITQKKELENLKGDVDRMMRHDLKTPLNGIIGFPQLIEMEGNLTEDQLELTRAITHSARKMLRMIDLSLDLFKMETGRYEYVPTRVDVISVLRELEADFRSKISAKQLTLLITVNGEPVSQDESVMIFSEESLLYSMLSNLITNAIEASPPKKRLFVVLDCRDGCLISITNAGAVPRAVRKNFFRKYHTSGKKHGTGLGTYSARMIANTMGYEIRMETSDQNNRTTLCIDIPGTNRPVTAPEGK
jgi:PAS domain S-box-containing protein